MDIIDLKNYFQNLLNLIGYQEVEIEVQEHPLEKTMNFLVKLNDDDNTSGILIGKGGDNLWAFELLLKTLLTQIKNDNSWRVSVDVNNYRAIYEEKLREIARKAAHQVVITKKPLELPPMPAKDRRIIHLEIALRSDVITESVGEGAERHIVIKPQ